MSAPSGSSSRAYGDKYEILEELGKGGFGRVLKARHRILGRIVALKQLSPGLLHNEEDYQRFQREAQVMDRISHPHIVSVFDAGVEQGFPYIEMDFIEGPNLETVIQHQGALPVDMVIRLGLEMASALAYTHAHGIIHRDIKASNILQRDADGQFFLTDFGTALQSHLTRITTGIMGSPEYMSPEQLEGRVVAQSDLYSLGVVLFEALTGQTPFVRSEGHQTATVELMREIRHETAPDVRTLQRDVPDWLAEVVARCLRKDPATRYESAEALEHALRNEASGVRPVPSRPTQRTVAPAVSRATARSTPTEAPTRSYPGVEHQPEVAKPERARHWMWGGGLVVLVLLLGWGMQAALLDNAPEDQQRGSSIAAADTVEESGAPAEDTEPDENTTDDTGPEDSADDDTETPDLAGEDTEPAEPTTEANVKATVDAYLNVGNDVATISALYADRVDYYDVGRVGQAGVVRDKQNYIRRWPERTYHRTSDVSIKRLGDDVVQARFEYRYEVAGDDREAQGTAWSLLTFRQEGKRLVIIAEKGGVHSQQ